MSRERQRLPQKYLKIPSHTVSQATNVCTYRPKIHAEKSTPYYKSQLSWLETATPPATHYHEEPQQDNQRHCPTWRCIPIWTANISSRWRVDYSALRSGFCSPRPGSPTDQSQKRMISLAERLSILSSCQKHRVKRHN